MVDWKLDIAKQCGADVVLNPGKCNLVEEINKLTDGLGCDVYIEATGAGGSVKFVENYIGRRTIFIFNFFQTRPKYYC